MVACMAIFGPGIDMGEFSSVLSLFEEQSADATNQCMRA